MAETLGISIALDTMAVTQQMGLPFNSFFTRGDVVYGLAPDGLYRLDAACGDVAASVLGPETDGGSPAYKRVRSMILEGKGLEELEAVIIADGKEHVGLPIGCGQYRFGRACVGRFLQIQLENPSGRAFEVTGIVIDCETLGRRCRGAA